MSEDHDPSERVSDATQPLDALCDEILTRHHAAAHVAVPRLRGQIASILEREPGALPPSLAAAFGELADTLLSHLAKEENILFPALVAMAEAERSGRLRPALPFPTVLHPIRVMESDHVRLSAALDALSGLTAGFAAAPGASDGVQRLMTDLSRFRDQLLAHLRAENDVLFPRALELDRRL